MRLSVLNLAPLREGGTIATALEDMLHLAQTVEAIGYERFWIAEHHNLGSVASSATQVLIGHVLARTRSIRVGSGGVMLPNHSPLMVAEQYGTLETLYPGRVDLGLGRAPGTDAHTAAALRRQAQDVSLHFPEDVRMVQRYLGDADKQGFVRAWPGVGTHVPLYILGSSTDSAYLAAELGLPYVFAAHFAPRMLEAALNIYRERFTPSATLAKPYFIVCLNVVAAATDDEADWLRTTHLHAVLGIARNSRAPLRPPAPLGRISPEEAAFLESFTSCTLVGGPDTLAQQYGALKAALAPDEIMVMSTIFDRAAQDQSYRLFYEMVQAA